MNFNKCLRCGCFFVSNNDTCPSCVNKDCNDISKLNNFFENQFNNLNNNISIVALSSATGISVKNLERFVNYKNFNFKDQVQL